MGSSGNGLGKGLKILRVIISPLKVKLDLIEWSLSQCGVTDSSRYF